MNELFQFPNYLEKYNKKDASSSEETSFSIVHNLYCLVAYIRQQCNVSCSLDCCGQLPLMICTSASNSSRQNLCPFCHALSQLCDVLVINNIYSVYAEHADLFSRSFSAHSWCSFHGQILLTAFRKFRFLSLPHLIREIKQKNI